MTACHYNRGNIPENEFETVSAEAVCSEQRALDLVRNANAQACESERWGSDTVRRLPCRSGLGSTHDTALIIGSSVRLGTVLPLHIHHLDKTMKQRQSEAYSPQLLLFCTSDTVHLGPCLPEPALPKASIPRELKTELCHRPGAQPRRRRGLSRSGPLLPALMSQAQGPGKERWPHPRAHRN